MYDDFNDSLAGDMSIPTAKKNTSQPGAPDFNTLDEPIKETIVRFRIYKINNSVVPNCVLCVLLN